MSIELTDASFGPEPGTDPRSRDRGGAFALPVSTSFRFALLIVAVVASSFFVYQGIYQATPSGRSLTSLIIECRSRALAQYPNTVIGRAGASVQASLCYASGQRAEARWGLLGVGVLIVGAGCILLAQPLWYRRRRRLVVLTEAGAADLVGRLEGVRRQAGTGPVVWLLQPLDTHLSAFAFGRPRRRAVAITGGLVIAAVRKPVVFDAVVLHELAHIRNRDIGQTYLALAIWRAFVVAAVLPLAALLIFARVISDPQQVLWRVAVTALIVYLLRNAILRAREFDVDARAKQLDPATALSTVLASLPDRTGGRGWHLGWTHPSGQERAAALRDPTPLYRFGFWDGLAVGLVAALGASGVDEIVTLLTTTVSVTYAVSATVFAAFVGPAVAVAMWRRQLMLAHKGVVKGWAAGPGLGLGLALGPVIALPAALSQAIWPNSLSLAAIGTLLVWTGLVIVIFTPFPVWVGHWADAWQLRPDVRAQRVPARGAMVAAAVAALIIIAAGLYLLLQTFGILFDWSDAIGEWHQLAGLLRGTALFVSVEGSGWAICLLVVGMPLAAAAAHPLWRRADAATVCAGARSHRLGTALLCVGGCITAVALTLAISAVTHARIAEAVRWNGEFLVRLERFDEQAIVVVAIVCALIAATRARSAVGVAISIVVAAAVAAIGTLALSNVGAIGQCFTTLNIQYAHPPASGCPPSVNSLQLRQVVLSAALVSTVFVPAAYVGGQVLRGRVRGRRTDHGRLVGWLATVAAVMAVVASVTGTALWGPRASARAVSPGGTIGNDGWIRGYGYDVRLIPNWYAVASSGQPGLISFRFLDGAHIELQSLPAFPAAIASYKSYLLGLGAQPSVLDGARGILAARNNLPGEILERWFIVRGPIVQIITLYRSPAWPQDSPYLRGAFSTILSSWRWMSYA